MQPKKTLVIGASSNPERYSNMAVLRLLKNQQDVIAIGNKEGSIDTIPIQTGFPKLDNIDTVTLYINPKIQEKYYNYILSLNPRRIIFNPGTENEYFFQLALQQNIICVNSCTLVMLSTHQY